MSDEMFGSVIGGQGSLNLEEEDIEDMHEVFNMIDLVAADSATPSF
jgi:hypothetical protein